MDISSLAEIESLTDISNLTEVKSCSTSLYILVLGFKLQPDSW